MDAVRVPPVRLECDLAGRGVPARAESAREVLAESREPVPSVGPSAIDHHQDYNEVPVMFIKSKCDDEDQQTGVTQRSGTELAATDVVVLIKEEKDFVVNIEKTEDELYELRVKQEQDIGPTLLQSQTTPCTFLSLNKDIPHSSTSSRHPAAPSSVCTVLTSPTPEIKEEDNHSEEDSEVLTDTDFLKNVKGMDDACQKISREQSHERSDGEGTSMMPQAGDSCRYCDRLLIESGSDMLPANADRRTAGKQHGCEYCKNKVTKKCDATNHRSTRVTKKPYVQCKYSTSQLTLVKKSRRSSNTRKLFKCEHCDYSAHLLSNLKLHLRVHTGEKPYKCEQCNYSASRLNLILIHKRTHTGIKPYKCEYCEYRANQSSNLKIHRRMHTGEKPYRCEMCDFSASRLESLKSHTYTHTGSKPYRCDQCDYGAFKLSNLKVHMVIHTGKKLYKCEQCKYSAYKLNSLKIHMRNHTGEKPYKCEHCEYRASELGCLKRHMYTHSGSKPYKCKYCDYSASRQYELKRHMRDHTGEKSYQCEHCEYRASKLNRLKGHMRTHTGEKSYNCEYCEYSASRQSDLKRHKRTHTGEKPYKCELCDYDASQKSYVKLHMLRRHACTSPA